MVKKELGTGTEVVFADFEIEPLAAASIGQGHRAILKNGEVVAVKIQRPGMKKIIEVDLEIMLYLATLMERHIEAVAFYNPVKIVKEFARALEKKIDYTIEAASMEHMAGYYGEKADYYIPKVYHRFSTSRVLTMQFVDGIKISDIAALDAGGLDRQVITRKGPTFISGKYLSTVFFSR